MSLQKTNNDIKGLILETRKGNQEAFVALLEQYRPLIDASVSRFSSDESYTLYREDLRQEASVVFYNSILAYDLEQDEVEFGLYAKICIYNALVSQLRTLKKHSDELCDLSDSLLSHDSSDDPSASLLEEERIRSIYAVMKKNLSDFEYTVWQYYASGKTPSDIASRMGTDAKSVSNAVFRVRKKLQALLK